MLQATNGFSEMIMLQSLPVTRHEQTPHFYRVLAILLEVNRLLRDLLSFCFPSFTVLWTLCHLCLSLSSSPTECLGKNGMERTKTDKQTKHTWSCPSRSWNGDRSFPNLGGGGGTIFGIFGHLKTFISRNKHLLRSAQPIFFVLFLFLLRKKKLTQTNRCLPNLLLPSKRTISRVSVIFDQRNMSLEIKLLKVQKKYSTFSYHEKISFFSVPTLND